jgi:uncharacterized protein (TIGR02246 family)
MRKVAALMLSLLLFGCVSVSVEHHGNTLTGRQGVADAVSGWAAAYNSRDVARIVAYYERDAIFWGTTSPTIRTTPEQITEYFKDAPKRPAARVAIIDQEIRVSGDMAVSAGSYTFTDLRDGRNITNPSRFTMVFRMRDGQWRLVHHHSSRMPS